MSNWKVDNLLVNAQCRTNSTRLTNDFVCRTHVMLLVGRVCSEYSRFDVQMRPNRIARVGVKARLSRTRFLHVTTYAHLTRLSVNRFYLMRGREMYNLSRYRNVCVIDVNNFFLINTSMFSVWFSQTKHILLESLMTWVIFIVCKKGLMRVLNYFSKLFIKKTLFSNC